MRHDGPVISTIAVLAGGLATRLRPATERIPKAMLDVVGEPFIAHQLRLFARESIRRAVLCVGYLSEQIVEFVGDGSRFGIEVAYSFDGDRLLGTGGALRKALPQLGDTFFVTYGDSYLDTPYAPIAAYFLKSGMDGLMTVFRNEGRWEPSNIRFEAGEIVAYNKADRRPEMRHIDFGLGILRSVVLEQYGTDPVVDLASVYAALIAEGRLAGYEVAQRFHEIGSRAGWMETETYIESRRATSAS